MDTTDLANRMKTYEAVSKTNLMRRTPVAIRIDGKAFHNFTRGMNKPFDEVLIKSMQETMKYLCENIQGCVLGYTQSDEITLILVDYKELNTSAWFDNKVQKICSIAASMATMAFNKFFTANYLSVSYHKTDLNGMIIESAVPRTLSDNYCIASEKGAMFDARCFNIPKEEVANLIYWRQLDAIRNSIQMVGQANFSHKELQNKSCNDIKNMLIVQKGINWDDFPTYQKCGSCCIKSNDKEIIKENNIELNNNSIIGTKITIRSKWVIDNEIPVFKNEGRQYIEKLI